MKRWKKKRPDAKAALNSFGFYTFFPLSFLVWFFIQPEAQVAEVLLSVSGTMFAIILAVAVIVNSSVRTAIEYWIGRVTEIPSDYPRAQQRFKKIAEETKAAWLGAVFLTICLFLSLIVAVSIREASCTRLWMQIANSVSVASLIIAVFYFLFFARRAMYRTLIDELRSLPPPPPQGP